MVLFMVVPEGLGGSCVGAGGAGAADAAGGRDADSRAGDSGGGTDEACGGTAEGGGNASVLAAPVPLMRLVYVLPAAVQETTVVVFMRRVAVPLRVLVMRRFCW